MPEHPVDLATWPRADQFRFFRTFDRPHYAITARIDVNRIIGTLKPQGVSVYRACLYVIGAGLHRVPELTMRFRGDQVVRHDRVNLSMTVPTDAGTFGYAYVPFDPDFRVFDADAARIIAETAKSTTLNPNQSSDNVAYLSCVPWLDYSSLNNAMPGPDDCIPRVAWGKIVPKGDGWDMAMTIEVHHALVDGQQVGDYFAAVQAAVGDLQPA